MFNWVVKVVPQPRGSLGSLGEEEKHSQPSSAQRKKVTFQDEARKGTSADGENSEENNAQGGMITWISSGFAYALPQPAGAYRANSEAKDLSNTQYNVYSSEGGSPSWHVQLLTPTTSWQGIGIIGWIVQGLGKVVPQLEDKYKESSEPEGATENQDANAVPDEEALPAVEVLSEDKVPEETIQTVAPSMVDWIKHGFEKIIPQPEIPGSSHCPPAKVTTEPPEAQQPSDEETNVVGWFVKGLGRMVPQPVLRPKEDTSEKTVVQNICICQQPGQLVVEDVEEACEMEQQEKPQDPEEQPSEPTQMLSTQQEETEEQTEATTLAPENSQEQLEAGSGEVKPELSTQPEENPSMTVVEEAAVPEEDPSMTVVEEGTQTEEDHSVKVAEGATQASSGEPSANIQEEEIKEVSECLEERDLVEGTPPLVSTETEPRVSEQKEAESEKSTNRDPLTQVSTSGDKLEPGVVTKQPEPTTVAHPPTPITQDDETADEGCGVSPSGHVEMKNSKSAHYSQHNSLTIPNVSMETERTQVTTNDEEAKQMDVDADLPEVSSTASVPPPPPVHRRSPMPRELPEDDEDVVSETSDCSMVIRMAPPHHGEAVLSVELKPSEGPESTKAQEEENTGPQQKNGPLSLLPTTGSEVTIPSCT